MDYNKLEKAFDDFNDYLIHKAEGKAYEELSGIYDQFLQAVKPFLP